MIILSIRSKCLGIHNEIHVIYRSKPDCHFTVHWRMTSSTVSDSTNFNRWNEKWNVLKSFEITSHFYFLTFRFSHSTFYHTKIFSILFHQFIKIVGRCLCFRFGSVWFDLVWKTSVFGYEIMIVLFRSGKFLSK